MRKGEGCCSQTLRVSRVSKIGWMGAPHGLVEGLVGLQLVTSKRAPHLKPPKQPHLQAREETPYLEAGRKCVNLFLAWVHRRVFPAPKSRSYLEGMVLG